MFGEVFLEWRDCIDKQEAIDEFFVCPLYWEDFLFSIIYLREIVNLD